MAMSFQSFVDIPHRFFLYMGWAEEFRKGYEDQLRRVFILPKTWSGKKIKTTVHFNGDTDGTNKIYFKASIGCGGVGEYWDNHSDDSGNKLIVSAPASAWITGSFTYIFDKYTINEKDQICLDIKRLGNDSSDTYTGSAYIMAIIIEDV